MAAGGSAEFLSLHPLPFGYTEKYTRHLVNMPNLPEITVNTELFKLTYWSYMKGNTIKRSG